MQNTFFQTAHSGILLGSTIAWLPSCFPVLPLFLLLCLLQGYHVETRDNRLNRIIANITEYYVLHTVRKPVLIYPHMRQNQTGFYYYELSMKQTKLKEVK